ncbi:MAG TPA: universal stress protein [Rhodanobacteraceae bacterium]|nr:universal stress protein [Rhodanobacteraceae bacterium]
MGQLDVLVHLRRYDGEPAAARAACLLAARTPAHLHGLYVAPIPPAAFTSPETVAVLVHESDRRFQEARDAGAWWQGLLQAHAAAGEWHVALADPLDAIVHAARWCDLVVVERPMQNPDAPVGWGLASRSVFDAGTPVLVVPDTAQLSSLGERVLVAWNGSREAARAVHGALPLLARAEQVLVLDGGNEAESGAMLQLPRFDLAAALKRHGVRAEFRRFAPGGGSARATDLLDAARAAQADLIVMGAWGHSRLTELVLGGITRQMFQSSDLPLLVAH